MDNLDEFHSFLEVSGATLLEPTNKYEMVRFRVAGVTSIIYKNDKGRLTYIGLADEAYLKFKAGDEWRPEKKKRTPIKSKRKKMIADRDGFRCFYCQKLFQDVMNSEVTLEHLLNVSHGGSNHAHNLVLSCKQCNLIAGDKAIVEKIKIRESHLWGTVK